MSRRSAGLSRTFALPYGWHGGEVARPRMDAIALSRAPKSQDEDRANSTINRSIGRNRLASASARAASTNAIMCSLRCGAEAVE